MAARPTCTMHMPAVWVLGLPLLLGPHTLLLLPSLAVCGSVHSAQATWSGARKDLLALCLGTSHSGHRLQVD